MAEDLLDRLLSSDNGEAGNPQFEKENEILAPLLEEINLIKDQGIRSFVRSVLLNVPNFWLMPGGRKHHPADERQEGGNVLHTQRVVRICSILSEAFSAIEVEYDVLIAAALIHDVTKYVDWSGDGQLTYDRMHPYTLDRLIDNIQDQEEKHNPLEARSTIRDCDPDVVDTILHIVRTHLGVWSPIPETHPLSMADWTLHLADNIASKLHVIVDKEEQPWRWVQNAPK